MKTDHDGEGGQPNRKRRRGGGWGEGGVDRLVLDTERNGHAERHR